MSQNYPAFEVSPVSIPGPDAVAPDPFRGLYGTPMVVTVPTAKLAALASGIDPLPPPGLIPARV